MIEQLRRRTARSGLEIILINVWEGRNAREEAQRFCRIWGVDGPVLIDEQGDYARRLGISGVPANVFVDADGMVLAVGATTPGRLEAETRRLLGPGADVDPA